MYKDNIINQLPGSVSYKKSTDKIGGIMQHNGQLTFSDTNLFLNPVSCCYLNAICITGKIFFSFPYFSFLLIFLGSCHFLRFSCFSLFGLCFVRLLKYKISALPKFQLLAQLIGLISLLSQFDLSPFKLVIITYRDAKQAICIWTGVFEASLTSRYRLIQKFAYFVFISMSLSQLQSM